MLGAHDLKAGYGIEKTVNDVDRFYPGGYVFIWWDRSFAGVAGVPDRGTYGYYEVNDFRTLGSAGSRIKSLYAQDRWVVGGRLALNLACGWRPNRFHRSGPMSRRLPSSSDGRTDSLRGLACELRSPRATERSGCSAAGGDTSTGQSLIWREQFSAVKSGGPTIARSTPSTCSR